MGRSPARPLSLVQRAVHMMVGATLMYALLMGLGMWRVEPRGRSRPFGSRSTPVIIPDLTTANGSAVLSPHWSLDAIRAKTWKFQTPMPRRCSQATPGTHLTIDDVAFGILTSNRFVETRLRSQKNTWLRQVRHVVFYSESDIAWLPAVGLKPPPGEQLVGGGAWKNFPALIDLHQRFPHQKWIFFNDDDTYVFVRNLLRTLNNYDPNKDYYIGLYWTPRIDMEWKEVQLAYASGGAGYALSHHMMRRLAPLMPSCHGNYTRWAGDVRVGKCIVDLGVKITPEVGFHHESHERYEWDNSGGGFPYGHLSNRASAAVSPPVTFHHLTVDHMALYDRMQFAEERGEHGELYRYDFGGLMFKQYIVVDAHLQRQFRVLFGISLEVSDLNGGRWRKDFADPLHVRRVPNPDGEGNRFEMAIAKQPEVFNGDGCLATISDPFRQPVRKTAIFDLVCTPCRRLGSDAEEMPGVNQICRIWREDACTLKVLMSIPCPARQVIYAQTLELGTAFGRADLITQGMPTRCLFPEAEDQSLVLAENATLWGFLTQGELSLAAPIVHSNSPGCVVITLLGRGDQQSDVMTMGGVLRSSLGPQPLRTSCSCDGSATHLSMANISLTLRVLEYTSPVVNYFQRCTRRRTSSRATL